MLAAPHGLEESVLNNLHTLKAAPLVLTLYGQTIIMGPLFTQQPRVLAMAACKILPMPGLQEGAGVLIS